MRFCECCGRQLGDHEPCPVCDAEKIEALRWRTCAPNPRPAEKKKSNAALWIIFALLVAALGVSLWLTKDILFPNDPKSEPEVSHASKPDKPEEDEAPEVAVVEDHAVGKEQLQDMAFFLQDVQYHLPMELEQLLDDGWELYDFTGKEQLPSGEGIYDYMTKGSAKIAVVVQNMEDDVSAVERCTVTYVEAFTEERASLTLPGDVDLDHDEAGIKASYGDPDYEEAGDEEDLMLYTIDREKGYYFWIDQQTRDVAIIGIEGYPDPRMLYYFPEDMRAAPIDVEHFTLGGNTYGMPLRYEDMEDNGWQLMTFEGNEMLPAGEGIGDILVKDDVCVCVTIQNMGTSACQVRQGEVTHILTSSSIPSDLQTTGKIDLNSSVEEVLAVYGDNCETLKEDGATLLYYGSGAGCLLFRFVDATGQMEYFSIDCCENPDVIYEYPEDMPQGEEL